MEFLEVEPIPRVCLQARPAPSSTSAVVHQRPNVLLVICCFFVSISFFLLGFLLVHSQFMQFIVFWSSLSLLLGPFAPPGVTGGDILVGKGTLVEFENDSGEMEVELNKKIAKRRSRNPRSERRGEAINSSEKNVIHDRTNMDDSCSELSTKGDTRMVIGGEVSNTVEDWSCLEDIALLKAIREFPKGVLSRWEKISAAIPGKSGTACMKRLVELKRDFRNSKSSGGKS